ncbi:transcription termination factor NusA [Candidatus Similichlamydia laticola]|uniref:Transcription termination/antitermination protein NusA n=1 Tax=Candidatus Similichlamydia laticola TaxID=2170265 RepID=A0A369KA30_9BACT|nr:transcription termination factor NusA [Candidatus Similichlamydia laticola]RDB31451.1 Transcription termination protein NusA [Candidatus Similichlamydia laticola]
MALSNKDLIAIFEYMEREKGLDRKSVANVIAESLLVAAKKTVQDAPDIEVSVDYKTGAVSIWANKQVVEKVGKKNEEISLKDAVKSHPEAQIGDFISVCVPPEDFGRIAAQRARQAIMARLRLAERDVICSEYRDCVGKLVHGSVKRLLHNGGAVVDLGRVEGCLFRKDMSPLDHFQVGDRVCALLLEVRDSADGGASLVLSRSSPEFVHRLLLQNVFEIQSGTVVVERIAREAGLRTKIAVRSLDSSVDPVKVCVGFKGTKIRNVVRELMNERVEIFPFSTNKSEFLQNALGSIIVRRLYEEEGTTYVVVDDASYAAALGKKGSNARLLGALANEPQGVGLVKWSTYCRRAVAERCELSDGGSALLDEPLAISGVSSLILDNLIDAGLDTYRKVLVARQEDLAQIPGISLELASRILEQTTNKVRNFGKEFETEGEECPISRADIRDSEGQSEDEDRGSSSGEAGQAGGAGSCCP